MSSEKSQLFGILTFLNFNMASKNSSQSTKYKRQRLMTESYELDRVEGLDLNEFNDRLDQRNEISTPVDINNDSEWKEFDNGDTEYDSDFDCSEYERLEQHNITDINGIKHNEFNFNEVVDHDNAYISLDDFLLELELMKIWPRRTT